MNEQPLRSTAIKRFLEAGTHADLASLYSLNMEVQVLVGQHGGERKDSEYKGRRWSAWTDGINTWKSFRIPHNAMTEPEYTDVPMSFDLSRYAEGIGMTGWDWVSKTSKWVAFDFDAIAGHSEKHSAKLSNEDLERVRVEASKLDWVTVRKSTSGKGLHLYVFLPDVKTANHTEHAALARAVLGMMSAITGFAFNGKVDNCGGNMWVWHTKMKGTDGLTLLKRGTVLQDVPSNWRDHVKVISGKRKRTLPQFVSQTDENDKTFEELTGQRVHVALDSEHRRLIDYLREEFPNSWWWDADHNMVVTHTYCLKKAHDDLHFKGIFETLATGKESGQDHNCFGGDTEVITSDGVKTLRELAGTKTKLLVLTPEGNKWVSSDIKSFGIQETQTLHFGDGSSVDATQMHQWLYLSHHDNIIRFDKRKATYELNTKTRLPLVERDLPEIDYEGYAHGFVFGDGWVSRDNTEVNLYGVKRELLPLLTKFGNAGSCYKEGHGYVPAIRKLPLDWKSLPENRSKEYWLGFILGLTSADGTVNTALKIQNKSYNVIEELRKKAIEIGLRVFPIREIVSEEDSFKPNEKHYYFLINTYNIKDYMLIRSDQKQKLIVRQKISSTNLITKGKKIVQEVFCAVVPMHHNFTLANHIVTGNCFCYPMRKGGWSVRRYTRGVKERETWDQDGQGFTRCYFNKEPDLAIACRACEGVEHPKGGFVFQNAEMAVKAALMLGISIEIPNWALVRQAKLLQHKDGRLLVEIESDPAKDAQSGGLNGWLLEKKTWKRMYHASLDNQELEIETQKCDDLVRHIVDESGADAGWVLKTDGEWHTEPIANIQAALASLGYQPKDIKVIVGSSVFQCWKIVNKPFQPEYPGDREWNRNAAQLAFTPSPDVPDSGLLYPNWQKILDHCGKGLDEAVQKDPWAKANGVKTGADYLKIWTASLFQNPLEPLPYLFFYGPQGSGKSSFHEALQILLKQGKGYVRADAALTNGSGFNGELEGAIVCVVEETNMKRDKKAYDRIKDYVTSKHVNIHIKGSTPFLSPNSTHWIQCANEIEACPVFPGDTRIVLVFVDMFSETDVVMSKRQLFPLLEKEASDFLAEIMSLEIPESNDRLMVPIIETEEKKEAIEANRTVLDEFVKEHCYNVTGSTVLIAEFYEKFMNYCPPDEKGLWSKTRIGRELCKSGSPFVKGRSPKTAQFYYGNISWQPYDPQRDGEPKKKLIVIDGMLRD